MIRKLIFNDIKENKLMSFSTIFFMSIAATLLILTTILFTTLFGTIDSLMTKALTPDFIQMHTGEINEKEIEEFVKEHKEIDRWQICRFLNLDNNSIILGKERLSSSTQDNGLSVQSTSFDYLLGMDDSIPKVSLGEVYVPVTYKNKYQLNVGDNMKTGDKTLLIKGFIRDSQMNAMMASSKRFLVNQEDYDQIKTMGEEEYLIEFLLKENSNLSSFQNSYTSQGLPANGPTITRSLIKMINALSDGIIIFVLFLVSVIALLISTLSIHFILSIQMERDRKEIGMLKALGIGKRKIKHIYFSKYIFFSLLGAIFGIVVAIAIEKPLSKQLRELYGTSNNELLLPLVSLLTALATEGIILLEIRHTLKRIEKISTLEALFISQKKGKGLTQYVLISVLISVCTFLMIVPTNLYNTLSHPSFVTYMGIGNGDIRIDIRQNEDKESLISLLEKDRDVDEFTLLETYSLKAILKDGSKSYLTVEIGNHNTFPLTYIKGNAPLSPHDIALSTLNAEDLGLSIGDSLSLIVNGDVKTFKVSGIYSDITNGGKTAKINKIEIEQKPIWSIAYASLKDETNEEEWVMKYNNYGFEVVNIRNYVLDTYEQTLQQLNLGSKTIIIIGIAIILVVLALFSRLIMERSRYNISLRKALGFTSLYSQIDYFRKALIPTLLGIIIGIVLSLHLGEGICQIVLKALGAEGFSFVVNKVEIILIIPILVLITSTLSLYIGNREIRRIKAYECCIGKE